MRKTITKCVGIKLGSLLLVAFLPSLSHAQGVQRTFVSGLGSDGNPCSRTAPCRTFGQAISQTAAGGEVIVLDSAGYGPFTINQSVSITVPPGIYGGISVFSGTGVTINTGSTDTVILRGLTINNQGGTGNGISFSNLGFLHVENCVVNGFNCSSCLGGDGLTFAPSNVSGILEVKDSIFRGNSFGIDILGGTAAIDHARLEGNSSSGLLVRGAGSAAVSNSLASGNGQAGFEADSTTSSTGGLTIENCVAVGGNYGVLAHGNSTGVVTVAVRNSAASRNLFGFLADSITSAAVELNIENCIASLNVDGIVVQSSSTGIATVRVSNSTVTQNTNGLHNLGSPAVILSRGNNTVEGNGADTFGTIGSYSPK